MKARLLYFALIAVIIASFAWQMALGLCPVP